MIIDCISDLHGFYPELDGGDVLIVAGDLTAIDSFVQHIEFTNWLAKQDYEKKVVIFGNHDGFHCESLIPFYAYDRRFDFLLDSSVEYKGLNIWGSPWTPEFLVWNFMKDRGPAIDKVWELIPKCTDILVTHGPPFGILDEVEDASRDIGYRNVGCEMLRKRLDEGVIKPKLMVFGHIHEQGGKQVVFKNPEYNCICVNASVINEKYEHVNKPIRVIL